jgi:hypothetical protein
MSAQTPKPSARRSRSQSGFVLPLVLWLVAIMAFGAAFISRWTAGALEQASLARSGAEAERVLISARANLTYLLVTNYLSGRGMEVGATAEEAAGLRAQGTAPGIGNEVRGPRVLRLDGRSYIYAEDMIVEIQDNRGLLNLNFATEGDLDRLLEHFAVPPEERRTYINRLLDYKEPGDLPRLGGAKRQQYLEAGKPPPTNQMLLTPWQARAVLGWDQITAMWREPGLMNLATTAFAIGFNINTAPAELLTVLFRLPAEQAAKFVAFRETAAFNGFADLQAFGAPAQPYDPLRFISFPADSFTITTVMRRPARKIVMAMALTPHSLVRPWRIDYAFELPFGTADAAKFGQTPTRFPVPAAGSPAR